jgi:hypothetical protein
MSTTLPTPVPAKSVLSAPPVTRAGTPIWIRVFQPLASLRLTVVLLVLSMILVFVGTLAQVDHGVWTVVRNYFRSFVVWVPMQIFIPRTVKIPTWIGLPYPGGWTLGGLLLLNLIAAHLTRFKITWKRSGILLIHAGIILLMIGELVTGVAAKEGRMTIERWNASNFVEDHLATELAFVATDGTNDRHVVVPEWMLRRQRRVSNDVLPVDLEVREYMTNSAIVDDPPDNNPVTRGAGLRTFVARKPEVTGVDQDQPVDMPSAYVALYRKGTDELVGVYLMSQWLNPQAIDLGGTNWEVSLRSKRSYRPYQLYLHNFKHEKYVGSDTPKNYEAVIRLIDPERNEDRDGVRIFMNEPLWYRGETFYQSSFLPGDKGTILQVVKNPGYQLPYLSCTMISFGLLVHFGMSLVRFLVRREAS